MLHRVKIEKFYEVEAENMDEIVKELRTHGYVSNEAFDYQGEYVYAEAIEKAGTPHKYEQLDC